MANRYGKRRQTSLVVQEKQVETTVCHRLTSVRMAGHKKDRRQQTLLRMGREKKEKKGKLVHKRQECKLAQSLWNTA